MLKPFATLSYVATLGGVVLSMLPGIAAAQLTGNAGLTSGYVWRSSSQTRERTAVQGEVKYAHDSGLYASVWGSNAKFKPDNAATSEFDITLGWSGKLARHFLDNTSVDNSIHTAPSVCCGPFRPLLRYG